MSWAESLIKLSNYEVETAAEAPGRDRRAAPAAPRCGWPCWTPRARPSRLRAAPDPEAAWQPGGAFREGLKCARPRPQRDIDLIAAEEAGARDALAEAFETLKKYEQVAETARVAVARESRPPRDRGARRDGASRVAGRDEPPRAVARRGVLASLAATALAACGPSAPSQSQTPAPIDAPPLKSVAPFPVGCAAPAATCPTRRSPRC